MYKLLSSIFLPNRTGEVSVYVRVVFACTIILASSTLFAKELSVNSFIYYAFGLTIAS